MDERRFETESEGKLFLKVVVPSVFSMIFASICMIVDGIFVGNYIGSHALAAVNIVMPIFMIIFALSDMIAVGSSVKVSMALGRKEFKEANSIFTSSIFMILALGAVFLLAGIIYGENIVNLFIRDGELAELCYSYIKPFIIFMPFCMIYFMTDNFLRICGKVNFSMWISILTSVMNIFLDWLLIGQLHLNIEAAAYATSLSMLLGAIISVIPFLMKKVTLKFVRAKISLRVLGEILYNGSSEFFQNISGSLMSIVVNGFLMALGGAEAISAYSIILYIDSIYSSILHGMTDSLQPAISYNAGRGNTQRIAKIFKITVISSIIISLLCMCLLLLGKGFLVDIFTNSNDTRVIEITKSAINFFAPSYIFSWFVVIVSSFLTSFDKPKESLVLMIFGSVIFPLLVIVIATQVIGLNGVFIAETIAQMLTFITAFFMFVKMRKLMKNCIVNNGIAL